MRKVVPTENFVTSNTKRNRPMNILLGVTGSIAAYKAAELTRGFIRRGHSVRVILTAGAERFITALTFQTLSQNPVTTPSSDASSWRPEHIANATWCDAMVIAPCTANVLAKLACGMADDPLTAAALATRAKLYVAPAMNDGMWDNPATQQNVQTLKSRGVQVVAPAEGDLACGTSARGRLAPLEEILNLFPQS